MNGSTAPTAFAVERSECGLQRRETLWQIRWQSWNTLRAVPDPEPVLAQRLGGSECAMVAQVVRRLGTNVWLL
jgi:hypothetical protein